MLRHVAASVAVVAVCLGAGCKKAPTAQSTGPSNKAEAPLAAAALDDVLAFLPVDADIVVGVDGAALRASALWQKFEPQIVDGLGPKLPRVREECGFDPMKSIERVSAGGKLGANDKFEGVMVIRGVSGAKTLECLAKATEGDGAVKTEGGVMTFERGGGEKAAATIVGGMTLVVQFGPMASGATLDAAIKSGAPLRGSQAFMALFERREPGSSVWGMVNGNAPFMAEMAQAGARPKSVDGTLVVKDRFVGALRLTFATPDDADKVNKQFQQIVPMVQGRFDKVDVRADGAIVRADVVATDDQLKQILGMFGGF